MSFARWCTNISSMEDLDRVYDSLSLNLHCAGKENLEWVFVKRWQIFIIFQSLTVMDISFISFIYYNKNTKYVTKYDVTVYDVDKND